MEVHYDDKQYTLKTLLYYRVKELKKRGKQ